MQKRLEYKDEGVTIPISLMSTDPSHLFLRRWTRSLITMLAVLVFLTGFARMFDYSFRGNDDTVWLYLTGLELVHASATAPLHDAVRAYLSDQRDDQLAFNRWTLRMNYAKNYLVPSALIYGASRVLPWIEQGLRANYKYGLFVALSIAIGVIMTAVIAGSVLGWAIANGDDTATSVGALLGLALISACNVLADGSNLAATGGPMQSIWYLIGLFFVAGPEYSIFGYTPRSQFYLCALAVFLLRWRAHWMAAYVLTVLLALLHQSMAGLFLILLIVIDLMSRPQIFDRKITAVVALGITFLFARETLFSQLGLWSAIAGIAIVVLTLASAAAVSRHGVRLSWLEVIESRTLAPLRSLAQRFGVIGSDLVIAFGLWLLSLPVAMLVSGMADPSSTYHFWAEIHIRVLFLLQPAVFVGLSILAIQRLEAIRVINLRWLYGTVVIAAILLSTPAMVGALTNYNSGLSRVDRSLTSFARLLGEPLPALDIQTREAVLYYAIALEIDSQKNVVRPMLARP